MDRIQRVDDSDDAPLRDGVESASIQHVCFNLSTGTRNPRHAPVRDSPPLNKLNNI
jgi:hypothetical protein